MLSRYRQQNNNVPNILAAGKSLIADYTFAKDALFAGINLKGDELEMYGKVHEALGEKIPKPDLLVYLQATTDTLRHRIAFRDRSYARQMERRQIDDVNADALAISLKSHGHRDARRIANLDNLPEFVRAEAKPGDIVVCLGAGDITAYANALPGKLEAAAA